MRVLGFLLFGMLNLSGFSCEKKVSVALPKEGSLETEKVEVEVSTDIPKVNRKLKNLKSNLQNTMNSRESNLNKKLPKPKR